MGLKVHLINLIKQYTLENYSTLSGLNILELGNQEVRPGQGLSEKTGKEYWTKQGMNHVSVDLNKQHGALKKDLTEKQEFLEFKEMFDVVYNSGTTEHVEPYEDQYACFDIIDMCTKPGGIMIHSIPEVTNHDKRGMWKGHCHYYYSKEFFETTAKESNYEILYLNVSPRIITSVLKKTEDSSFMQDKDLFLSNIAIRNQNANFNNNSDYTYQNKKPSF